jgi:hypothetical protein
MAYTALLVSEQRLKQWTNLDSNVRTEEITPWIISAQDVYCQTSLGTQFLNRLKAGIVANDLNADEILLLNDYIAPMLMQYSLYLMMPGLKYKLVEKGVVSGNSEDTDATSLEELKYLRQSTLDLAEFYDARLREYLCDVTAGTYPEYSTPTPDDGMNPEKRTPYFGGLVTNINNYGKGFSQVCSNCANNGCTCE